MFPWMDKQKYQKKIPKKKTIQSKPKKETKINTTKIPKRTKKQPNKNFIFADAVPKYRLLSVGRVRIYTKK